MNVDGKQMRPIWLDEDGVTVRVIDQRQLPHRLETMALTTVDEVIFAIQEMVVRGAPLIGVTGAYGVMVAALTTMSRDAFAQACDRIKAARPTAVNLAWAVDRVTAAVSHVSEQQARIEAVRHEAGIITQEEVDRCRSIGEHGASLVADISRKKGGEAVNILTHCNAGWLACVEWGTATAPVYVAHEQGIEPPTRAARCL
ncbi:MAG: S-methyl-5-thioribose-1-phosphate isomerase, partial [Desulfatitalea sp.]|nr:S-methyl-5-thioribose-1-phosphate isomerase [Desulfatitalea sp.]NNK00579.1 S-methyl-5-thioribose-1-phosphate isomerase [Desulfatitalea sp.]